MKVYRNPYDRHIRIRHTYLTSPHTTGAEVEAARKELLALGENWTPADVERVISGNPNWKIWAKPERLFCAICGKRIDSVFLDLESDAEFDGFLCLPCMKKAVEQMEVM